MSSAFRLTARQDITASTARRGQDMDNSTKRWEHLTPGAGSKSRDFPATQLGSIDKEISTQMPGNIPNELKTRVRARAIDLTNQSGNPASAVQQALSEIVEKREVSGLFGTKKSTIAAKGAPVAHKKPLSAYQR